MGGERSVEQNMWDREDPTVICCLIHVLVKWEQHFLLKCTCSLRVVPIFCFRSFSKEPVDILLLINQFGRRHTSWFGYVQYRCSI